MEGERAVSYWVVLLVGVSVVLGCLSELEEEGPEDELGSGGVPLADLVYVDLELLSRVLKSSLREYSECDLEGLCLDVFSLSDDSNPERDDDE